MFAQANVMYGLETPLQGHWPAPNDDFVAMWDRVAEIHNSLSIDNHADIGRQWNNKGNSMEALMLCLFQDNQHLKLWQTLYVNFHVTHEQEGQWFSQRMTY